MKKKPPRITFDVTPEIHHEVKMRAAIRNTTIRGYVLQILLARLKMEERFEGPKEKTE